MKTIVSAVVALSVMLGAAASKAPSTPKGSGTNGFSSIKLESVTSAGAHFGQPGYETSLLYLAALVALVLGGSGPLALDRFFVAGPSSTRRTSPSIFSWVFRLGRPIEPAGTSSEI